MFEITHESKSGVEVVFDDEKYCFVNVKEQHDIVSSDVTDNDVAYCGDTMGVHYTDGLGVEDIPRDVVQFVKNLGYNVVIADESGWDEWRDQPAFSKTKFIGRFEA